MSSGFHWLMTSQQQQFSLLFFTLFSLTTFKFFLLCWLFCSVPILCIDADLFLYPLFWINFFSVDKCLSSVLETSQTLSLQILPLRHSLSPSATLTLWQTFLSFYLSMSLVSLPYFLPLVSLCYVLNTFSFWPLFQFTNFLQV